MKRKKLPPGVQHHEPTDKYRGRAIITARDGAKARRSTSYYDTPYEAADALAKLKTEAKEPAPDAREVTLEMMLGEWLAKPNISVNTRNIRARSLAVLIPDSQAQGSASMRDRFRALRTKRVADVDERDLQNFLDRLGVSGVGSRSIQMAFEGLRAAFRVARKRRLLTENPVDFLDRPSHESKAKRALTGDEDARLKSAIMSTRVLRSRALLLVLYYGGVRIGEALGLRWSSVDFEKQELKIIEQIDGPLKTAVSRREVPLIPEVLAALSELKAGATSDFVFAARGSSKPLDASNFRAETFAPMCERAGLADVTFDDDGRKHIAPRITPHTLRMLAASRIAPHVQPVVLQRMFGWAKLETAARFYVRTTEAMKEQFRDAMSQGQNGL